MQLEENFLRKLKKRNNKILLTEYFLKHFFI